MVREVFQQMVNMRAAEVAKAVELLTALATDKLLTAEHFGSGIPLESMDDIAEDCPKVFESLAVVLSKVLSPLSTPDRQAIAAQVLPITYLEKCKAELSSSFCKKVFTTLASNLVRLTALVCAQLHSGSTTPTATLEAVSI